LFICQATLCIAVQEPTLFATTIYENIMMGLEGATEEQVWPLNQCLGPLTCLAALHCSRVCAGA
jgi:ABC-type transport system involved in cytochrome bd biosynthesis fused ATPase/permease subunit